MNDSLANLKRRFAAIPKEVRKATLEAVNVGADEMVKRARTLAPSDDGDLQNSIRKEPGEGEAHIRVMAGGAATTRPVRDTEGAPVYDYALAQELGTARMRANPFFYPAWSLIKRRVRSRIMREARKAIKDAR